ncbi:MAG TPA: hypothetical protein VIX17_05795 [Pyrinomonadaceae bacterium]
MKAGSKKTKKVLVVDVGGTHVKALATGHLQERKIASGLKMTASKMAEDVKRLTKDWEYDVLRLQWCHDRYGFGFAAQMGLRR